MTNKRDSRVCPVCKGLGEVVCLACNGSGKTKDSICHVCNGTGLVECYYCSGRARISSKGDLEVEVHGMDSKDVETVASALLEKVAKHRPAHRATPWISGSFYLFVFAVVIAVCLGVAKLVPLVAIPIVLLAGILAVSVIGAFQLRQNKKLSPTELP